MHSDPDGLGCVTPHIAYFEFTLKSALVIGGGIIGLFTARELLEAGFSVTVIDQSSFGTESSWAGGGILAPLRPWTESPFLHPLWAWGYTHYPEIAQKLCAETGIDPELRRCGILHLRNGRRSDESAITTWAKARGISVQSISAREIATLEPALANLSSDCAWRFPDLCQIRNPRLIKALANSVTQRGAILVERTELEDLRVGSTGTLDAILTSRGALRADCYVLCTGAWSGRVLPELEVRPVKGQMLLFDGPTNLLRHVVIDGDRYLIPRADGHVLAGSTVEHCGFDKSTPESTRRELLEFAVGLCPALGALPIERHWAGLRPGSRDGVPTVSRHPEISNLFLNCGHYRNGVSLAPGSARLVADLIVGRRPFTEPEPYQPRKALGRSTAGNDSSGVTESNPGP